MRKWLGFLPFLLFLGCARESANSADSSPRGSTPAVHGAMAGRALWMAPANLPGSWVEPIPGAPDGEQGFVLHADGSASSINMATLRYTHWRANAETLQLAGESIGNGVSSTFEDAYRIVSVDERQLVLMTASGHQWTLSRAAAR